MRRIMARTIGIGRQDFEKIRISNNFYVDKTDFIRQWWEAEDDVTRITRPRRSGKTLNMSMVEQFFSVGYAGRGDLFEGLSIWQEEKYRQLQGTYPVIALSFAKVKETSYQDVRKRICRIIADLYRQFDFLLDSGKLGPKGKELYQMVSADMEAYVRGYWEELVQFTRSLFGATFKTNPYLERAIMTGITRVSKESMLSDLNNLEVVTTTSEKYADCFGFTQQERHL